MNATTIRTEAVYVGTFRVVGTPFHIVDTGQGWKVTDKWGDTRYRYSSFTACMDWCEDWAR